LVRHIECILSDMNLHRRPRLGYFAFLVSFVAYAGSTNTGNPPTAEEFDQTQFSRSANISPYANPRVHLDVFVRPKIPDPDHPGQTLKFDSEFVVTRVDGQIESVRAVASGMDGFPTRTGHFSLRIPYWKGEPYPFTLSTLYENSSMYWGLNYSGGFWIHATPYYNELGHPASHGCVRLTSPSAMEMWDLVVNRYGGSADVNVIRSGSQLAIDTYGELGLSVEAVNAATTADIRDAHAVTTGEYLGYGHARIGQPLVFPNCGSVDCFDFFGRDRSGGSLPGHS
jgi:hypothetical protein